MFWMLAFMQAPLTLAPLLLHWLYQGKSPRQRRMQQVQFTGVGSPRGDWWEKQKRPHVPRAAWVRHRPMSRTRQIELSGNPRATPPSRMVLLACVCLLDWESTGVLFPSSFQREDWGPGAEPRPCSLPRSRQQVTACSQGLPGSGKGSKAKNRLPMHPLYCTCLRI